jgi:signal transduction histidine kinase
VKRTSFRLWFYLAIDSAILVVCFLHIPSIVLRPTTPFEIEKSDGQLLVRHSVDARASGGVKEGDVVVRWREQGVANPEALEFLADLSSIGDTVRIEYRRAGTSQTSLVTLVPFYPSLRFIIITIFVGIVMWGVGIYVLWNGWRELAGRVLHWVLIFFAAVVMLTWGAVLKNGVETLLRPVIFLVSYEIGVPLFFFFTVLYPRKKAGSAAFIATITFIPATVIFAASTYFYLRALNFSSVEYFNSFQSVYDVFHAALLFYIGGGILNLIHSYITAETSEERQRLKWILWGFIAGAIPFIFLFILPQLFFSTYLIDEEYLTIFFLVIPFAFAVSFIKYRLFDIEVVINRSIVYSVLTVFIVAAYVLTVLLVTSLIGGQAVFEDYLFVVGVTLVVAWLINPLRGRIQRLVDESLFAARTNFRAAITKMSDALHKALSSEELFSAFAESIRQVIPSEALAVYRTKGDILALEWSYGSGCPGIIPNEKNVAAVLTSSRVIALPEATSFSSDVINTAHSALLKEIGFAVCVPIKSESSDVHGMLALRPRSAKERYDENEIDLLVTLSAQAAEILERLSLQERIILEREAKKRFEELSDLKSEFVSYVSHELRTPLTSIKMFSDLLKRRLRPRDAKAKEYMDILDGEADRLNRMVSNLLDAARIDKGAKEYFFADVDLSVAAQKVLETMKYQFHKHQFKVECRVQKRKLMIHGDADAVAQAIINLMANSIKYSTQKRFLRIDVLKRNNWALCRVSDHGDGISDEAMPHLFEKFYRGPSQSAAVQGVGLGLPLVKHIMDAHNGRVEVRSTPGKGSVFTLFFPTRTKQN